VAEDEMIHAYREFAREQTLRLERAFRGFSRQLRERATRRSPCTY
jgi:hypothetical protein